MNISSYLEIAKGKINNKFLKTLILSIYAGVFISLAAILSTVVSFQIQNYSIAKILSGLVFPIGLILVILFKCELFTGNSLLVIPLISRKISLKQLIRNFIIVYIGNLIGSLIVSLLIINTPISELLSDSLIKITNTKISYSFVSALILGVMCNFLVCISVYLSSISKSTLEKIFVIFIPIFTFIVLSLEHSIANMFYLSIGYLLDNSIHITDLLLKNLLPVTIGNIIGGMVLGISIWYLKEKKL
ncbi:MAG: formate/nitrite transporter family protein [Bacilli bacterium]|nr:formate/nitrite transporter family protein [Bacilli bacterium]